MCTSNVLCIIWLPYQTAVRDLVWTWIGTVYKMFNGHRETSPLFNYPQWKGFRMVIQARTLWCVSCFFRVWNFVLYSVWIKKKAVGKKSSWMFVQSLVDAVYYVFWVFQKEKEGGKCVTLCTAHKCSVILFMGYKNVHQ